MKHNCPTSLFSHYRVFHYSKCIFFSKFVNIYCLFPWFGKPALLWKVRSVCRNHKQNEMHSKSLTAKLIINVNFSSIVGKNIFKTH